MDAFQKQQKKKQQEKQRKDQQKHRQERVEEQSRRLPALWKELEVLHRYECQDLLDVAGRSRLSHVNADIDRIIQGRKQLDMDFTDLVERKKTILKTPVLPPHPALVEEFLRTRTMPAPDAKPPKNYKKPEIPPLSKFGDGLDLDRIIPPPGIAPVPNRQLPPLDIPYEPRYIVAFRRYWDPEKQPVMDIMPKPVVTTVEPETTQPIVTTQHQPHIPVVFIPSEKLPPPPSRHHPPSVPVHTAPVLSALDVLAQPESTDATSTAPRTGVISAEAELKDLTKPLTQFVPSAVLRKRVPAPSSSALPPPKKQREERAEKVEDVSKRSDAWQTIEDEWDQEMGEFKKTEETPSVTPGILRVNAAPEVSLEDMEETEEPASESDEEVIQMPSLKFNLMGGAASLFPKK